MLYDEIFSHAASMCPELNKGIPEAVINRLLKAKGYAELASDTAAKLDLACYAIKKFKPNWTREQVDKAAPW